MSESKCDYVKKNEREMCVSVAAFENPSYTQMRTQMRVLKSTGLPELNCFSVACISSYSVIEEL